MHVTFWLILFRNRCRSQRITVVQLFGLSWCLALFWAHVESFPSVVSLQNCCYWGCRMTRGQVYHRLYLPVFTIWLQIFVVWVLIINILHSRRFTALITGLCSRSRVILTKWCLFCSYVLWLAVYLKWILRLIFCLVGIAFVACTFLL